MKFLKELFFLVLFAALMIFELFSLYLNGVRTPAGWMIGITILLTSYGIIIRGWKAYGYLGDKWYWFNRPREFFADLNHLPPPPQKKDGKMKIAKELFFLLLFLWLIIYSLKSITLDQILIPNLPVEKGFLLFVMKTFAAYWIPIRGWKAVTYFAHRVKRKKNNPASEEV